MQNLTASVMCTSSKLKYERNWSEEEKESIFGKRVTTQHS